MPIQKTPVELPVSLFTSRNSFIVIAHRGARAYYPENTLAAFKAALEMDADMIELDITLSKDNIPVVIHDEKLNRTTNGIGLVSDHDLEELKKLDAGYWFHEKFSGEKIPTLEEVLIFAKDNIALNIEIKPEAVGEDHKGGIEEISLELVKKYEMEQHVLFSSFNYRAITHLKKLDQNIAAAILYERNQAAERSPSEQVSAHNADAFNCNFRKISQKWMDDLNEHNIPVFIYTVNREREMQKMIEMGVSGIFTDKPDVLKDLVDKMWEIK